MVIVDTSVVAKWFLPEEDSDRARDLLDKEETIAVPDLLRYELCNTFSCSTRLTRPEIADFLDTFFNLKIEFHTLPNSGFYRIVDLSREFQISAYDATFVALAETLKTSLVTADRKLAHRTRKLGIVRTLEEIT